MRESESGTLPRAKVWYGAKPNNRVSQQTQAKSEMLAKGGLQMTYVDYSVGLFLSTNELIMTVNTISDLRFEKK